MKLTGVVIGTKKTKQDSVDLIVVILLVHNLCGQMFHMWSYLFLTETFNFSCKESHSQASDPHSQQEGKKVAIFV